MLKKQGLEMDLKLEGRTCIVTGASSGIGRGIVRVLAHEGVRLAIAGRDAMALESLKREIIELNSCEAIICIGDVATEVGVQQVCTQAQQGLGRIR